MQLFLPLMEVSKPVVIQADSTGNFSGDALPQRQRRLVVAPPLDRDVYYPAIIIDGPPQIYPLPADSADRLVQMPTG